MFGWLETGSVLNCLFTDLCLLRVRGNISKHWELRVETDKISAVWWVRLTIITISEIPPFRWFSSGQARARLGPSVMLDTRGRAGRRAVEPPRIPVSNGGLAGSSGPEQTPRQYVSQDLTKLLVETLQYLQSTGARTDQLLLTDWFENYYSTFLKVKFYLLARHPINFLVFL